jgi:hypothetical protein
MVPELPHAQEEPGASAVLSAMSRAPGDHRRSAGLASQRTGPGLVALVLRWIRIAGWRHRIAVANPTALVLNPYLASTRVGYNLLGPPFSLALSVRDSARPLAFLLHDFPLAVTPRLNITIILTHRELQPIGFWDNPRL